MHVVLWSTQRPGGKAMFLTFLILGTLENLDILPRLLSCSAPYLLLTNGWVRWWGCGADKNICLISREK